MAASTCGVAFPSAQLERETNRNMLHISFLRQPAQLRDERRLRLGWKDAEGHGHIRWRLCKCDSYASRPEVQTKNAHRCIIPHTSQHLVLPGWKGLPCGMTLSRMAESSSACRIYRGVSAGRCYNEVVSRTPMEPVRDGKGLRVNVPRLRWVAILFLTLLVILALVLLLVFYVPEQAAMGYLVLGLAGLGATVLLLIAVFALSSDYLRTQKRLLDLLAREKEAVKIEQQSAEIILELNALVSKQTEEQARLNEELRNLFMETIRALVATLEARDRYTEGHSVRVANWTKMLGNYIGLSDAEMEVLERGSLLHDIGKIGIPDQILHKPGRLTEEEFAVIKEHPARGEKIVEHIRQLSPSLPVIRWHHERPDGRGYPDGLTDIPKLALITSVCDCFDAMTSERPYRQAMTYSEAKSEMLKVAGNQHDKELTLAFFEMLETTEAGYRSMQHVPGLPPSGVVPENNARLESHHERSEILV